MRGERTGARRVQGVASGFDGTRERRPSPACKFDGSWPACTCPRRACEFANETTSVGKFLVLKQLMR